jgi:hypothetical protein
MYKTPIFHHSANSNFPLFVSFIISTTSQWTNPCIQHYTIPLFHYPVLSYSTTTRYRLISFSFCFCLLPLPTFRLLPCLPMKCRSLY